MAYIEHSPMCKANKRHLEWLVSNISSINHMGVSLNGGIPKTPQTDHFW